MNSTVSPTIWLAVELTSVTALLVTMVLYGVYPKLRGVSPTTALVVELGSVLPLLVVLAFFGLHPTIHGHSLQVGRYGLGALFNVKYSNYTASKSEEPIAQFSIAALRVSFRLPRPSDPRWCIIVLEDFMFADYMSTAKADKGIFELSAFPRALGTSAGPWVFLVFSGLDVSVTDSGATPQWLQRVRTDVARALVKGTILRADYARTAIHFTPPTYVPDADTNDEMVFSASARGFQVKTVSDRLYDVGSAEWGCRRSWMTGGGAMWVFGKDIQWTKQRAAWQTPDQGWKQIIKAFSHIPASIYNLVVDPAAHVDVSVTDCRVAFSAFRVHDAEIVRQGAILAHERFVGLDGGFSDLLWGLLARVIAPSK